jgi:hypothetical protein
LRLAIEMPRQNRVVFSAPYVKAVHSQLGNTVFLPDASVLRELSHEPSLHLVAQTARAELKDAITERLQPYPDYGKDAMDKTAIRELFGMHAISITRLTETDPPVLTPLNPELTRGRGAGHPGHLFSSDQVHTLYQWLEPGVDVRPQTSQELGPSA